LRGSLGIATGGDHQGIRTSPVSQPEPVPGFTVGGVSNGAGIQDIDVSLINGRY